jgi:molybdate transport system ATP-binding protein
LRAELCVPPGLTVLLGPSGAGKSLTLRAIAGLAPLEKGTITLGERVLADAARGLALPPGARRVGYVPQSSALFTHLSVSENVAYALARPRLAWPWGAPAWQATQRARVAELLALVRLPGFEGRAPGNLSGGEAQRVALARALAAEPEALLLDEPLSALDAPTRAALRDDLRAVVLMSGVPALIVTHDLSEARALADRLIVLVRGRVVAEGARSDVLAGPPTVEAARLLGWRNVLPIAETRLVGAGRAEVRLAGGQRLAALATDASPRQAGTSRLALRADALALTAGAAERGDMTGPHQTLAGTLRGWADMGAYYAVTVELAHAPRELPPIELACSPREWAALGVAPGAQVEIQVPAGAARLVSDE